MRIKQFLARQHQNSSKPYLNKPKGEGISNKTASNKINMRGCGVAAQRAPAQRRSQWYERIESLLSTRPTSCLYLRCLLTAPPLCWISSNITKIFILVFWSFATWSQFSDNFIYLTISMNSRFVHKTEYFILYCTEMTIHRFWLKTNRQRS